MPATASATLKTSFAEMEVDMRMFAPVWRHTSIFFVSQLLILLCAGLCFLQWNFTQPATQPTPLPALAHAFYASLQPFASAALLLLLGSSALFAAYQVLGSRPPSENDGA